MSEKGVEPDIELRRANVGLFLIGCPTVIPRRRVGVPEGCQRACVFPLMGTSKEFDTCSGRGANFFQGVRVDFCRWNFPQIGLMYGMCTFRG